MYYRLPPTDPRWLDMTPEQAELEWAALMISLARERGEEWEPPVQVQAQTVVPWEERAKAFLEEEPMAEPPSPPDKEHEWVPVDKAELWKEGEPNG